MHRRAIDLHLLWINYHRFAGGGGGGDIKAATEGDERKTVAVVVCVTGTCAVDQMVLYCGFNLLTATEWVSRNSAKYVIINFSFRANCSPVTVTLTTSEGPPHSHLKFL